jgi:hypothetical protein
MTLFQSGNIHINTPLTKRSTPPSLKQRIQSISIIRHLPLSEEAYTQFNTLKGTPNILELQDSHDSWTYIWDSSYSSSKRAYNHLSGSMPAHPVFQWLWKSSCQNKHKIFFGYI